MSDDGPLSHLALRACEVRALPHATCDGAQLDTALARLRPWAVLDAREAAPPGAGAALARACGAQAAACALVVRESPAMLPPGVLAARVGGPLYFPWRAGDDAVRWLCAIDRGQAPDPRAGQAWRQVYGPDLVDAVLDLLLDGFAGLVDFTPRESLDEAAFAAALARVAAGAPLPPAEPGSLGSGHLPLLETTLERFVREARTARAEGEDAVQRREDDTRLEDEAPRRAAAARVADVAPPRRAREAGC